MKNRYNASLTYIFDRYDIYIKLFDIILYTPGEEFFKITVINPNGYQNEHLLQLGSDRGSTLLKAQPALNGFSSEMFIGKVIGADKYSIFVKRSYSATYIFEAMNGSGNYADYFGNFVEMLDYFTTTKEQAVGYAFYESELQEVTASTLKQYSIFNLYGADPCFIDSGEVLRKIATIKAGVNTIGTTGERPVTLTADDQGFKYFDLDYNKTIEWTGSDWIGADLVTQSYTEAEEGGVNLLTQLVGDQDTFITLDVTVNIFANTGSTLKTKVVYQDSQSTPRTKYLFEMGSTTSSITTVGDIVYPSIRLKVKSGSTLTVVTEVTGAGTVTYDANVKTVKE